MLRVKSNQRNARNVDRDDSGAFRETPPEIRQGRPVGEGLGKKSPPQYREQRTGFSQPRARLMLLFD